MRLTCISIALLGMVVGGGCAQKGEAPGSAVAGAEAAGRAGPQRDQSQSAAFASVRSPGAEGQARQFKDVEKVIAANDPAPLLRPTVHLAIVHLTVPFGTVCANEQLWKRVDEQALDVATYDVLFKNGLRVGRVPYAEYEYFDRILNQGQVLSRPAVFAASGAKLIEISLKKDVMGQVIYDFDRRNAATITSYDRSENLMHVEFEPAARNAGAVQVSLVPLVRTMRKRLVAISDVDTREFEYRSPEKLYDLSLRAELGTDSFLIVAASSEARAKMSLGYNFLVQEGTTGLMEDVLLIIPQAVQMRPTPGAGTTAVAVPQEQGGAFEGK